MATQGICPAPFALPVEFVNQMQRANDLFEVGDKAQKLGQDIIEKMNTNGIGSEYVFVANFVLKKALKTMQSAQILCRCGYGSDSLSLCAVLFENLIDLLFISQAPARRSRRFCQFETVEKYLQAKKVLSQKRLPKGRRKKYTQYLNDLHPQVKGILKYFKDARKGWSQKSLFQRAQAVKAGLVYQELYWVFCAHKHTLPMVASGLVANLSNGYFLQTYGPDTKGVCDAAEQSTRLFLQICLAVDMEFNLSFRDAVTQSSTKLQSTVEDLRKAQPDLFS